MLNQLRILVYIYPVIHPLVMKVPVKEPIEEILINVYWVDQYSRGSKSFETIQDFKEFLLDNKELAKALGYVEKQKSDSERLK